ncbi:Uncharacterized protein MCB1EB_0269 [Mycoavidus cysteinexigens]|uniref:Uncharacterized protein n=1 Tax=Mycoavidus cysteinexigens TaxID=1553431 RepID=A0A2Z6EST3_9BURK|nr:ankyrin repeat domain-containing protein [Mycoavidus cysteinexigens]BBE08430.1 Uncharacterized protein MCB1EB_0269 [Mycoavidus cysteinexigens]GAM52860.1 hypothetical protein EBME_1323 [bacterium endosymbiont of Mortierella elongata FMR23-6]GLR00936.1 hypothetical protein GCM10007934_07480 [Mycoavidus cysteinexigens]
MLRRTPPSTSRPATAGEAPANEGNASHQLPRSENTTRSSNSLLTGLKDLKAGIKKFFQPSEEIQKGRALRAAVRQRDAESVTRLLANGANPNLLSRAHGNGALHLAATSGDPALLSIVANHPRTNVLRPNLRNQTAATLVNASGNQEMIEALIGSSSYLAFDPSPEYEEGEGRTENGIPLYIADRSADPGIEQLIEEAPASSTLPQETATHTPSVTKASSSRS